MLGVCLTTYAAYRMKKVIAAGPPETAELKTPRASHAVYDTRFAFDYYARCRTRELFGEGESWCSTVIQTPSRAYSGATSYACIRSSQTFKSITRGRTDELRAPQDAADWSQR